ncbi:response regulator [Amycolatopsis kentuckyensis]|uniref:response regulator n=1 Tax=Amycolatopsis kentuckyensis TaxID=218823 RepID=UPI001FC9389E|nr:response regulator transcription factor [Amycolatopsis kentuckyensis]
MNQQANELAWTPALPARRHVNRRRPEIEVVPDVAVPTVVLADTRPAVRRGVRAMLERSAAISVVGEAATTAAVLAETTRLRPDVLVIDLQLGDDDGIAVIAKIVRVAPGTAVLVFSEIDDDRTITAAFQAGARGYLIKDAGADQILRGVQAVAAGEAIVGQAIAGRLGAWLRPGAEPDPYPFAQLTAREREVLDRIAAGKSNPAIATELALSPKTISNRVSAIFAKLGTADRARLIVMAREAGLGLS